MPKTSEEIRNFIISEAGKRFSRYGLSKTTIDDIAKSVHMGKSSLYYYFPGKEEIFKAVLEKETEVFKGKVQQAMAREESPRGRFRAYALTRMQCFRDLVNVYAALKEDYLRQYAFIQELRQDYDRQEVELVKQILADGVGQGHLVVEDLELTSSTIVAAIKGLEYAWAVEASGEKLEKNMDKMLEVLFYGLHKR